MKTNQKIITINGTTESEIFSHVVLQARNGSQKGLLPEEYINNCTWYYERLKCTILFIRVQGCNGKMTTHPMLDCCFLLSITFDPGIYDPRVYKHIAKNVFAQNVDKCVSNVFYNKDKLQYHYNSRLFVDNEKFEPIEFNEEILQEFLERKWLTKNSTK